MNDGPVLLEVEDLTVRFDRAEGPPLDAVKGVGFELREGEILCIVGESGSGKTVLTRALMGLISAEPGVIGGHLWVNFDGTRQDILADLHRYIVTRRDGSIRRRAGWWRRHRRQTQRHLVGKMGLIFQNPRAALDPLWTVGRQVAESARLANPDLGKKAAWTEGLSWLRRVHIHRAEQVAHLYPHELSGGMCQRVAIAQILAMRTPVVIADEPTTGLDATIQAGILDLIKEIQREYGLSVILITHDFQVVERLADRILVLYNGEAIQWGDAEAILAPNAQNAPYTQHLLDNVRALEDGDLSRVTEVDDG